MQVVANMFHKARTDIKARTTFIKRGILRLPFSETVVVFKTISLFSVV